ncbi:MULTISPECIES: hypothetical protein [unclassified Nonomuraea]|uniref:hypothetical protein n=1 Tax=unclassified Nonomuraea TaxID=2593643 RepID=UPI00340D1DD7
MLTRSRPGLAMLGMAALAVLGGCGGAAESARPTPSKSETDVYDAQTGKDFYRAHMPKQATVMQQIIHQYGT